MSYDLGTNEKVWELNLDENNKACGAGGYWQNAGMMHMLLKEEVHHQKK